MKTTNKFKNTEQIKKIQKNLIKHKINQENTHKLEKHKINQGNANGFEIIHKIQIMLMISLKEW